MGKFTFTSYYSDYNFANASPFICQAWSPRHSAGITLALKYLYRVVFHSTSVYFLMQHIRSVSVQNFITYNALSCWQLTILCTRYLVSNAKNWGEVYSQIVSVVYSGYFVPVMFTCVNEKKYQAVTIWLGYRLKWQEIVWPRQLLMRWLAESPFPTRKTAESEAKHSLPSTA